MSFDRLTVLDGDNRDWSFEGVQDIEKLRAKLSRMGVLVLTDDSGTIYYGWNKMIHAVRMYHNEVVGYAGRRFVIHTDLAGLCDIQGECLNAKGIYPDSVTENRNFARNRIKVCEVGQLEILSERFTRGFIWDNEIEKLHIDRLEVRSGGVAVETAFRGNRIEVMKVEHLRVELGQGLGRVFLKDKIERLEIQRLEVMGEGEFMEECEIGEFVVRGSNLRREQVKALVGKNANIVIAQSGDLLNF